MTRHRAVLTASLALFLATGAGCGATGDGAAELSGEEARVAQVVEDLEEAAREGEERRICRQLLFAELARRAGDCNRAVSEALDASDLSALAVENVDIQGSSATARVASGTEEKERVTMQFARVGRDWRIAAFGTR